MEKNVDGTTTILNGNVTLNDWLHFKGHIELRGDLETMAPSLYMTVQVRMYPSTR